MNRRMYPDQLCQWHHHRQQHHHHHQRLAKHNSEPRFLYLSNSLRELQYSCYENACGLIRPSFTNRIIRRPYFLLCFSAMLSTIVTRAQLDTLNRRLINSILIMISSSSTRWQRSLDGLSSLLLQKCLISQRCALLVHTYTSIINKQWFFNIIYK